MLPYPGNHASAAAKSDGNLLMIVAHTLPDLPDRPGRIEWHDGGIWKEMVLAGGPCQFTDPEGHGDAIAGENGGKRCQK